MNTQKGQTLFAVVVFLGIVFIITMGLFAYVMNNRVVTTRMNNTTQALNIAEAGVSKAVWCLNNPDECAPGYSGETTSFGGGEYTTVLTSIGGDYTVESLGTFNSIQKKIKVTISKFATSAAASFYYGVQVGAGGLTMNNNSYINGSMYSNGSISGGAGSYITGDIFVAGGTALAADQEQTTVSSDFPFRSSSSNRDIAQSFKPGVTEVINYVSFYLKKDSNPGDASVHIVEDDSGQPATSALASGTLDASMIPIDHGEIEDYGWIDVSFDSNPMLTQGETYWIVIDNASSHSSKYFITGKHDNSGYGNGLGLYGSDWTSGSWTSADGDFTFKTWMGGVITEIDNVTVTAGATVHANTIKNSDLNSTDVLCNSIDQTTVVGDVECGTMTNGTITGNVIAEDVTGSSISGDLTCETQSGNTVSGSINCPTPLTPPDDPPPEALPISDAKILEWKQEAEDGGIINDNYTLDSGATESLGPIKITGNLLVSNSSTLNIAGNIWVEGTLTFDNLATIRLDSGYSSASGLMISDGKITVQNNCVFQGSGHEDSYVLILTTNNSLDSGSPAIDINNNADTVIFYAADGLIKVANNAQLKEATGYALELAPNASVTYVSGLANAKFANGPGGIWSTQKNTWQELE